MAKHVCPWWIGFLLASPIRRLFHKPEELLPNFVKPGMTVLEPGPGMGFFTLPMARLVGEKGRVIAVDIQPNMLESLRRRAIKAGVTGSVETRLAQPDSLGLDDLSGTVDLVLAFAMVHEMPSAESFFQQAAAAMKPGATMLLAEPAGHVKPAAFAEEIEFARRAGLDELKRIPVPHCEAAVLAKRS